MFSTSLPVDKAPAASALAGSSASAIGYANVFAPAIPDTPVSSLIDSVTAIPDPSSSLSVPLAEESDAPAETSTVSSQIPSSRSTSAARSASAIASSHHASASKTTEASDMNKSSTFSTEATQPSDCMPTFVHSQNQLIIKPNRQIRQSQLLIPHRQRMRTLIPPTFQDQSHILVQRLCRLRNLRNMGTTKRLPNME